MQCLDLIHSQICWIMMSSFPCQGRIICRKSFGSSGGPEGSPWESWEFDMTLQGELKDSAGQLSPQSLGCLFPYPHSSSISISQRSPLHSQRSLSFSLVVLLSLPCLSYCMLDKCCPLQALCLRPSPFLSPSPLSDPTVCLFDDWWPCWVPGPSQP